jgi:hypothetical protein
VLVFLLNSETQSHAEDQDKAVSLPVILYGYDYDVLL